MSSRQEEKERRRQERLEREQAEASKASSRRRLQLVAGVLLGVAVAVVAVLAITSGGGDDGGGGSGNEPESKATIPAQKIADFDEAVKASGCVAKTHPSEGREHLPSDTATNDRYKTNPPTSGTHRPTWAEDGIYTAESTPDKENWVHALEHGRIIVQYKPGTPQKTVDQLETLLNERVKGVEGYHTLLLQNNTDMDAEVAAVAWTQSLTCPAMNDQVFDAIRAFRERYTDKGPELIP